MGKAMTENRLRYIDIARGIAIICIILGHLGNKTINSVVFTFHVPIFFFITGFFISSKKPIKEFVKAKFRTLIVPYILTCLVIILLGTLQGWFHGDAVLALKKWAYASLYGAGDTYKKPFYIPQIGALWFLLASFFGGVFLRISLNFKTSIRLAFIACLFAAGYYSRALFWFPFSIQAGACSALFMYMGFLLKNSKETLSNLPQEVKYFGVVIAVIAWISFIHDFKGFWLVHCNIGRGIVDIFGCICACAVVILISKILDSKTEHISEFLSYFGKYSLLVLCVHIIELNLFPWWSIAAKLVQYGLPEYSKLLFVMVAKLTADLTCVYVLSKISFVKRLYGIRN